MQRPEQNQLEQLLSTAIEENEILRDRVTELEALLVAAEEEIDKKDEVISELASRQQNLNIPLKGYQQRMSQGLVNEFNPGRQNEENNQQDDQGKNQEEDDIEEDDDDYTFSYQYPDHQQISIEQQIVQHEEQQKIQSPQQNQLVQQLQQQQKNQCQHDKVQQQHQISKNIDQRNQDINNKQVQIKQQSPEQEKDNHPKDKCSQQKEEIDLRNDAKSQSDTDSAQDEDDKGIKVNVKKRIRKTDKKKKKP